MKRKLRFEFHELRDLNLTMISHLILNLGCDFIRKLDALFIVHLIRTHDDTEFTTCLDSVSLGYAKW